VLENIHCSSQLIKEVNRATNYRKVNAIIRRDVLEKVEQALKNIGVDGISVTKVKGYGEYANFYSKDWMVAHARIEIFTHETKADVITKTIMDTACLELEGDGIIAVLPVEKFYRIRARSEMSVDEF